MSLADVLIEARRLVSLPDNNFTWATWDDAEEAIAEIDGLLSRSHLGPPPMGEVAVLFMPTGDLQEVSISSGWGNEFIDLANRYDAVTSVAARARLACVLCGDQAGKVELTGSAAEGELRREGPTGDMWRPATGEAFEPLRAAVASRSARVIYDFDSELAPFYCPSCDASYCGEHWEMWDVMDDDDPRFRDSVRGCCPRDHERILEG
jgi:hypothetical protein